DRVFRIAEMIAMELERGVAVVIGDRENGFEDGLQADLFTPLRCHILLEKLLVRLLLDLDQIRDLDDRRNLAEIPPDSTPARDSPCHTSSAPRCRWGLIRPAQMKPPRHPAALPRRRPLPCDGGLASAPRLGALGSGVPTSPPRLPQPPRA